ncbi:phosphonate ABC transporter ATP-binding protein [Paraburkholderia phenazinium]|uniref:Phosphonate transport system ATP-binding protein n=1 Tax=Paraburkholderia phenazinium TaxID=60549 RepID=A0A1G7SGB5_9BURK|nr:phosphonate ABC transporter ATP-binding protein [Paraburkholderia phenazinium]SDG22043.1 phosphonate transport system ATP-binding protein [Paraburkholderia phenazinium]
MNTLSSASGDLPLDPVGAFVTAGSSNPGTAQRTSLAPGVKLAVRELTMRYDNGHTALRNLNLSVRAGEMVVVLGSNGSGKSTFMKCVVGLNRPTGGAVELAGRDLATLSGKALREARLPLTLISQNANLVKRRSVLANVCCGTLGRHRTIGTALGRLPREEIEPARAYLDEVGLLHLASQRAGTLSGGQAQRVAVARALAQRPHVLLADEPVASLDPEAADEVMRLLRRLASEDGLAVVCVLHQPDLATRYADRLVGLRSGQLEFDRPASAVSSQQIASLYLAEAA